MRAAPVGGVRVTRPRLLALAESQPLWTGMYHRWRPQRAFTFDPGWGLGERTIATTVVAANPRGQKLPR